MPKEDNKQKEWMFCSITNIPVSKDFCEKCKIKEKRLCYLYGEINYRDIDIEKVKIYLEKLLKDNISD